MNETTALQNLYLDLQLDKWWIDLIQQPVDYNGFDVHKAEDNIPRTELKAAKAIRDQFENSLSYVESENRWYLWDGKVHAPCDGDGVATKVTKYYWKAMADALEHVKGHYDLLARQAASSGSPTAKEDAAKIRAEYNKGEIKKHKTYRDRVASEAGMSALVRVMKTELDVPLTHFENDRQWLVVRNGVIDLQAYRTTGKLELLDHDASRPVTRYFDADYDPAAGADTWKAFLASSIVDDGGGTVKLLQKAVGAAFSAEEKPRALFNLLGAPASGKSVFLSVFNRLGQDYSVMPNNQAIQLNNGDTNFYQDALRGARFVGFSEVQGKKPLDDGFLKGVLGGDQQETRQMRQTPKVWKPQCVLFIASNMALKFNTRDEATFIKILPIPFPHSFTTTDAEHRMDRELESKVLEERSGILSWVLEGMAGFWREGLDPTEAVLRAMDGNKTANSHALRFMEAMLENGLLTQNLDAPATACLPIGTAYEVFKSWTAQEGISNVPGKHMFTSDIADFYFGKSKGKAWTFTGLEMSPRVHHKVEGRLELHTLASEL
jgi:P4 family phage/plasmid primase-like protien